jgi:hypothetical protein
MLYIFVCITVANLYLLTHAPPKIQNIKKGKGYSRSRMFMTMTAAAAAATTTMMKIIVNVLMSFCGNNVLT